jgi:eukaryotic-like serine/threonine-protein kinase
VGQTISHYRVLSRLGEGGMGVVYLAEDLVLKRPVALKFLPAETTADPEARARLVREAQAAAALMHPGVCPVYEIAEADGRTFIAMAHLEGRTLRARLGAGPVPLGEALAIARQLAEGLAAAHARGIMHRDVKPANVMLLGDGRAVLMDFGLARVGAGTRLTRTGTTLGTAAYMAPEQALGREADARSDVWALGAVLYELVAGRVPFAAEHEAAQLYAIVNVEPKPLTAVAPGVPAGLNGIVTKALAKDAARRYASAAEMAADLLALERDMTAEPAGKGRRTRRQRAWLAASLALGAVALLVGLTVLNVGGLRERLFEGGRRIRSIAVLPLANLSGDASQEYFADGMTEALINDLGQVGALRIISRTSAMSYKGTKKPLRQIARELGVDAVVEGSVQRSGDRVRISAQLIRAGQERQVWAQSYERELRDVLIMQAEIARAVVSQVRARLTPAQAARLASARPVNPIAHQLYLKGKYHLERYDFPRALGLMTQAVAADSLSALAHVGLAGTYNLMATMGTMPTREAVPLMRRELDRAIELDENLADAHAARGNLLFQFEWDWAGAERELDLALRLDPNNWWGRMSRAVFYCAIGRPDDGIPDVRKVVSMDPVSAPARQQYAWVLIYARRHEEATAQLREGAELDPVNPYLRSLLAWNYALQGRRELAATAARACIAEMPEDQIVLASSGYVLGLAGKRTEALETLERLRRLSRKTYVDPYNFAWLLDGVGETDSTVAWLERSDRERSASLYMVRSETWSNRLRADARFQRLIARMHFPPARNP